MMRVYSCLASEHDPRLLLLAVGLCLFASLTSLILAQRGRAAVPEKRRRWLVLAGIVTGLSIWVTHFAAMLAYRPAVAVRFDVLMAMLSVLLACAAATLGWLVAFRGAVSRPTLGGLLIGVALVLAHFLDMMALRIAGDISYDGNLIAVSIVGGLALCIVATRLLAARSEFPLPLIPALVLACGILFLHFVAMAAVSITPTGAILADGLALGMGEISFMVIAAAVTVLLVALGLGAYDRRIAELTARDAEQLKRLVAALEQSEQHHRYSVELNPQIPWVAEPDGAVSEASSRWSDMVGAPASCSFGDGWMRWVHPDDLPEVARISREAFASQGELALDVRYRLRHRDGTYRWYRARARARRDEHGAAVRWYGNLEDIHEQVVAEAALRASEERYRLASRATRDIIWDWAHDTDQIQWSDAIETVLGYPEAKAGTSLQWMSDRLHPDDRDRVQETVKAVIESASTRWHVECRLRNADGTYFHFLSRGYMVRSAEGRPLRSVGALLDITAIKRVEDDLRWAAQHDPLTGLPNRALFADRLAAAFAAATPPRQCVGLITLDVDRFKSMNDSMGHGAGDAVLRAVSERLLRNAPPGATVARLGGDEFAVILPGLRHEDARIETVLPILADMETRLSINGCSVVPSLSAGAAMWPKDGADAEELLKSADLALYAAKMIGPGAIRGFRPAMREEAKLRSKMLDDAQRALVSDRVIPFYQPKVDLRTGELVGLEALLRWHDPGGCLMPPAAIAAAFDDVELSVKLTDRMLEKVLANVARWLGSGLDPGRVSINGAAADFARDDFAERILRRLAAAGVAPSRLELEVTETVFLGKLAPAVERALRTLSAAGVTIALDDFGTGYASLTLLQKFPVHTLKIDRSFVSRLPSEKNDAVIVGAVIDLARRLNKITVAEGIETEVQAKQLAELGCDAGQGYLFGEPVEAFRIELMLGRDRACARPLLAEDQPAR